MQWHTSSMPRRQTLRAEVAMVRSSRPQATLIIDLPVPSEPEHGPERWRG